jgi:hypothetical protein
MSFFLLMRFRDLELLDRFRQRLLLAHGIDDAVASGRRTGDGDDFPREGLRLLRFDMPEIWWIFAGIWSPDLLKSSVLPARNRSRLPANAAPERNSLDATYRVACCRRWLGRGVLFGADRTPA